ncbi:MAG: class I SAM-dependent methyltransferase [Novosphingobium sp.]
MSHSDDPELYWNSYYTNAQVPELPSQFAVFVANELVTGSLPAHRSVVDLGCGNGRDSLFFAQLGFHVGCIDRSEAAIAACEQRFAKASLGGQPKPLCRVGEADGAALGEVTSALGGPVFIYSRFFFHAIDDAAEQRTIDRIGEVLGTNGGMLAVEFRSTEDEALQKSTPPHYRRYVDPAAFAERLQLAGLNVIWQAKGTGMAKYKQDDAHVARIIAKA